MNYREAMTDLRTRGLPRNSIPAILDAAFEDGPQEIEGHGTLIYTNTEGFYFV